MGWLIKIGLAAALGVIIYLWLKRRIGGIGRMAPAEARALLGVAPGASLTEIRDAHRRLIARVHPDAGGSADLATRVNAARDVLVDEAGAKPPRIP